MILIMETSKVFSLSTSKYKILHTVTTPTRMSDYDYDEYGNRYIMSYLHTLEFHDKILGNKIYEFSFPSDACAEMILILYKLLSGSSLYNGSASVIITPDSTSGIYSNIVFSYGYQNSLTMRVTNSKSAFIDSPRFVFANQNEVLAFINLLEVEDIIDMYVVPSSDRW